MNRRQQCCIRRMLLDRGVRGAGRRVQSSRVSSLTIPFSLSFSFPKNPPQCAVFAVPWCLCSVICMLILVSTIPRGSCCHRCALLIISMQVAFTNAKSQCRAKAIAIPAAIPSQLYGLQGCRMWCHLCVYVCVCALLHVMVTEACVCRLWCMLA